MSASLTFRAEAAGVLSLITILVLVPPIRICYVKFSGWHSGSGGVRSTGDHIAQRCERECVKLFVSALIESLIHSIPRCTFSFLATMSKFSSSFFFFYLKTG